MELAALIPATTMIKLARINSAGALVMCFTLPFIEYPFTPFNDFALPIKTLAKYRAREN
jgi:hypothetical protein